MAHYKDGKYWRQEQDDDMRIMWTTDSNTKEWLEAYRRTLPRLKIMGESILRRYYSYFENDIVDDLVMDAITQLIVSGKYNPEKPKLYSYCGTIIKRYFYDRLVIQKRWFKNGALIDDNYDITDDEWVIDNVVYEPDFEYLQSERQEMLEHILLIIDTGIEKTESIVVRNIKRNRRNKKTKLRYAGKYENKNAFASIAKERELCFLYVVREYFLENFIEGTVSSLSMADYIDSRCDLPNEKLSQLQNKYFGIGSQPAKIDGNENAVDFTKRRGLSYIMDDEPLNEVRVNRSRKDRIEKKNKNIEDYKYF